MNICNPQKKKWAVYAYIQANNNLRNLLLDDIDNNYQKITKTEDMYISAQISYPKDSGIYEDIGALVYSPPTKTPNIYSEDGVITKRYEIKSGQKIEVSDMPYQNMSSPKTLKEFLVWAMTNYPAENTMVVFTDHGQAWMGTLVDETSKKNIQPQELKKAIDECFIETGKKPDILVFDSCFMANAEFAYELQGCAKILIGSEEFTSYEMSKKKPLNFIAENNGEICPDKVAEKWVESCYASQQSPMVSAISLEKMPKLGETLSDLSKYLIEFIKKSTDNKGLILKAVEQSCHFGGIKAKYEPFEHLVDLISFIKTLAKSTEIPQEIKNICKKIEIETQNTVLYSTSTYFKENDFPAIYKEDALSQLQQAESLTIYLPTTKEACENPWKIYNNAGNGSLSGEADYKNLKFAKDTKWHELFSLLSN